MDRACPQELLPVVRVLSRCNGGYFWKGWPKAATAAGSDLHFFGESVDSSTKHV